MNFFKSLWRYYTETYDSGHYIKAILFLFASMAALLGITIGLFFACVGIINFIMLNFESVLFIVGGWVFLWFWIQERKKAKMDKENAEDSELSEAEKQLLQAKGKYNYELIVPIIFDLIREKGELLKMVVPTLKSDIYAKRLFTVMNGFIYYHFEVDKQGDVNINLIREVLQRRIWMKLRSKQITDLSPSFISYNESFYPILYINKVAENDTCVQITIVITSENFMNQMDAEQRAKLEAMGSDEEFIQGIRL